MPAFSRADARARCNVSGPVVVHRQRTGTTPSKYASRGPTRS